MAGRRTGSGGLEFLGLLGMGLFSGFKQIKEAEQRKVAEEVAAHQRMMERKADEDLQSLSVYLYDEKMDYYLEQYLAANLWHLEFAQRLDPYLDGIHYEDRQVDTAFFRMHYKQTKLLMMAIIEATESGKVPRVMAIAGYETPMTFDYPHKLMWQFTHECMLVIDKRLREHGKEKLLFLPHGAMSKSQIIPATNVEEFASGKYYWNRARRYIVPSYIQ